LEGIKSPPSQSPPILLWIGVTEQAPSGGLVHGESQIQTHIFIDGAVPNR
jgi:hypothetical protein